MLLLPAFKIGVMKLPATFQQRGGMGCQVDPLAFNHRQVNLEEDGMGD
jgi:hypothetical protein